MARYKKNYLNGSLFGNFNSNVDDKFNYFFDGEKKQLILKQ